ncbi:MAG: phosphotransferase enzyme family protein [Chitinophagaceae bacterium]
MIKQGYQEAAMAFEGSLDHLEFTPCSGGLINTSFKVTNKKTGNTFFLQQINTQIFLDPTLLQNNYFTIWEHFSSINTSLRIAQPLRFENGDILFNDQKGGDWRVSEFIDSSTHFLTPQHKKQLSIVAEALGNYVKILASLDPQKIKPVIPKFHDLEYRFTQFEEALQNGQASRIEETKALIDELLNRKMYVLKYQLIRELPAQFPIRLLHHDAKIANLLFDDRGEEVVAVIDLDTTMPGLFFSDLGDMIRSMVGEKGEQSTEWKKLTINVDRYTQLVNGYLQSISNEFTLAEKDSIHYAGLFMLYMQSLRFLSDYLTGDHYYKTERPGQNRDRAMNQFILLKKLEEMLSSVFGFNIQ